jgi:hypothetical protein
LKKERRQVLGRESLLLASLGLFHFAALFSIARSARRRINLHDPATSKLHNLRTR